MENQRKNVAILGSTGSIGTQTLEIIRANPSEFEVELLTAHSNATLLIQQATEFHPNIVIVTENANYNIVKDSLKDLPIKVYSGSESIDMVLTNEKIDVVIAAMVGIAGLKSTLKAIQAGRRIGLANKETLVVAGDMITKLAIENKAQIIPVDSEHSAIFQCLVGEIYNPVEKIILTASGGPFRGYSKEDLQAVTKNQALSHPNWSMGAKVTIDSATLMNKGLEVIEAKWLFDLEPEQIEVIIHPQSIVHSLVQFEDGSLKAQLGLPDMKIPIQYALTYPTRLKSNFKRFSFTDYKSLDFEQPDTDTFPCLQYAFDAIEKGGTMPCIMNAANEVAIEKFLGDEIHFADIPEIIATCMANISTTHNPSLEDYLEANRETKAYAAKILNVLK